MRTLVWSLCMVVLLPIGAGAQGLESSVPAVSVESLTLGAIPDPPSADAGRSLQSALTQRALSGSSNSVGAATGAIIGGEVGAAFGIGLGLLLCDGSHCYISGYVKAALMFGGIGAAIGAAIGAVGDKTHRETHPSARRVAVDVVPVVTRETRGAVVSMRFGH